MEDKTSCALGQVPTRQNCFMSLEGVKVWQTGETILLYIKVGQEECEETLIGGLVLKA